MITLFHCMSARSFRPLWVGALRVRTPYKLPMLPFPPRQRAREYLSVNPLSTVPKLWDPYPQFQPPKPRVVGSIPASAPAIGLMLSNLTNWQDFQWRPIVKQQLGPKKSNRQRSPATFPMAHLWPTHGHKDARRQLVVAQSSPSSAQKWRWPD